ncbi:MAG: AAA family ATPase [Planctomycetaceae bacterium]|nr:AAA family ATPase [Planctomycetaceae bacterium]
MSLETQTSGALSEPSTGIPLPLDQERRVVEFLRRRTSYADIPRTVQLIETHISQVFVTDRFVYKLKKPVRFDFLDFSTVEQRRQACEDEVRLNRRQARDVYLGVHPIWTDARGQLHLDGLEARGPVVDYVVQMRRLPTERTLDVLIQRHLLTDAEITQLAATLTEFYLKAPSLRVRPEEYRRTIERHVRANRAALHEACPPDSASLIQRVHTAQLRALLTQPEMFDQRVQQGHIIEGHGDLRPEHICLVSPPVIFDCVEFNAEFRQLDVADELSFLAMECDLLGAPAVGKSVIECYQESSGDRPTPELWAFYKSYRACVRAKVAALRGKQVVGSQHDVAEHLALDYLHLADEYLRPFVRPLLMIVGGMMGSGKSTLARAMSESLGATWLRSDVIRQTLFPGDRLSAEYNAARYRPESRTAVYDALLQQAGEQLRQGASVVLDATFGQMSQREAALALAQQHAADCVWIECRCPREVAMQRITQRLTAAEPDASEARPELYDRQAADWQSGDLPATSVTINTTQPLDAQLTHVYEALGELA